MHQDVDHYQCEPPIFGDLSSRGTGRQLGRATPGELRVELARVTRPPMVHTPSAMSAVTLEIDAEFSSNARWVKSGDQEIRLSETVGVSVSWAAMPGSMADTTQRSEGDWNDAGTIS